MSRKDVRSPNLPFLSPIKSETDINKTILTQLFSKEFLGCLKVQLNTKLKQTKSNETEYKKLAIQAKTYKRELMKTRAKIQELTQKNNELITKLAQYQILNTRLRASSSSSKKNESQLQTEPTVFVTPPNRQKQLTISRTICLHITQQSTHLSREQEISMLRDRIEKLQIYKSIKDQRINQLLQKQVRFDSQMKYLKVKNDQLQQEVKSLRQTIVIQTQDQKALKATYHEQRQPEIAISYHHYLDSEKNMAYEKNLMMSYTNNVDIPESQDLSKMYNKKHSEHNSFNQIDYLIEQQLPYLTVSAELNPMNASGTLKVDNKAISNLNQSIVLINL